MATIKFKRGSTGPSGLTLGEPAWDYSNGKLFVGVTSSAIWVGAEIDGSTGLGTSQIKIPTQNAVKVYVDSVVSVGSMGPTGPTGPAGATGATGPTGAIPTDYVISVNGATGAITNVAKTNTVNTFTQQQSFASGISAAGGLTLFSLNDVSYLQIYESDLVTYGVWNISANNPVDTSSIRINSPSVLLGDLENYWSTPTTGHNIRISPDELKIKVEAIGGIFETDTDQVNITATPNPSGLNSGSINLTSYTGGINLTSYNSGTINVIGEYFGVNSGTIPNPSYAWLQGTNVYIGDVIGDFGGIASISLNALSGIVDYVAVEHRFIAGGTATFSGNVYAPNIVNNFNGRTGAVQGVSAAVAGTGISVSGATGSVTISNTGVLSFNGSTGAVVGVASINGSTGAITNVARINEGNTFSVRQVMNAGITSANLYVSGGSTFNGSVYFASTATVENSTGILTLKKANTIGNESATLVLTSYDFNPDPFTSTITATTSPTVNTVHTLPSVSGTLLNTASNYVSTFNGRTGAVQGVSAAVAGTGISVSGATGSVTITNTGVLSVNGQTGDVTVTSGSSGVTGISAGDGISISGPTGNVVITNTGVLSINGSTGAVTNVNAATVTITNINTNATYYPLFSTGTGATALYGDFVTVPLTYNPSTGSFQSRKFRAQGTVAYIEADGQVATISLNDGTNLSTMSSIDFASSAPIPFSVYSANESVTIAGPKGVHFADLQYGEIEAWGYTFPTGNGLSGQGLYTRGDGQLYWNNAVYSVNGQTGDVTISAASAGVTGIVAGSGISISGPTGNVTITNVGVLSVNGQTGAVTISGSGISRFISSISTDTTAGSTSSTDYVYIATAGLTLTMPTAVSNTNLYTVKTTTSSVVKILTTSSQTIDGATAYDLNKQYQAIGLLSDGSDWSIV